MTTRLTAIEARDLEVAFSVHMPWLHRRIALIVGDPDEAQDLAQEAFARALERWPIGSHDDVARWLATVGIRLAIDEMRRRHRWGFLQLHDTDAAWAMSTDPDLWRAISGLEPAVRAALLLTVLDGYTQEEVAEALGVARGTVSSWLSQARDRLRPAIGSSNDG
ncbi:MAG TPA: RNA polymerase sigma factor [Candidatus Limnocylindrales bacterium]